MTDEGMPLLRLAREDSASLTEAALRLAEYEPIPDVSVQGVVTNLKEEPGAYDGLTTVEALIDGKLRRINITFPAGDDKIRDALIDAFRERKRISLTGELVRRGRTWFLETPRELNVVSDVDQ